MSTRNKVAYVQLHSAPCCSTDWFSDNCGDVAYGLRKLGWTVKGFQSKDLHNLPLTKNTLVKATVGITRKALDIIGVPQPKNVDIPESIRKYAGRKMWETTLGDIRNGAKGVFIKPLHRQKAFSGMLLQATKEHYNGDKAGKRYRKEILFDQYSSKYSFPDSFPILAQQPVEWEGEWRAYVLRKQILGIVSYCHSSSYTVRQPSRAWIEKVIKDYKEQPVAYALDIGNMSIKLEGTFNEDFKPAIVEVNEAYSAGNMGISRVKYTEFTITRWKELMKGHG